MKKISILLALLAAFALTFVTTGCKNGEDGDDGLSAEALILRETGNKWYKYTSGNASETKVNSTSNGSLANVYLKYDTANGKLIIVAAGDSVYATDEKELTSGKWASSVVSLRVLGKISYEADDPTSGKNKITDITTWGDFTLETLIKKLFE